jgi:hypothetical protein
VQLVHNLLGRHPYSTHKQLGLLLDNHINQVVQPALGVVVVGLAGVSAYLGNEEVDTEWEVWGGEGGFELADRVAEVLRAESQRELRRAQEDDEIRYDG